MATLPEIGKVLSEHHMLEAAQNQGLEDIYRKMN